MKRIAYSFLTITLLVVIFASCSSDSSSFDQTLLVGKWKSGTLFYRYDANGTGVRWNTADDVAENEGKKFNWTLDNSTLTQEFQMEIDTRAVPKVYTVTKLTDGELNYEDNLGKSFSFTKQK